MLKFFLLDEFVDVLHGVSRGGTPPVLHHGVAGTAMYRGSDAGGLAAVAHDAHLYPL